MNKKLIFSTALLVSVATLVHGQFTTLMDDDFTGSSTTNIEGRLPDTTFFQVGGVDRTWLTEDDDSFTIGLDGSGAAFLSNGTGGDANTATTASLEIGDTYTAGATLRGTFVINNHRDPGAAGSWLALGFRDAPATTEVVVGDMIAWANPNVNGLGNQFEGPGTNNSVALADGDVAGETFEPLVRNTWIFEYNSGTGAFSLDVVDPNGNTDRSIVRSLTSGLALNHIAIGGNGENADFERVTYQISDGNIADGVTIVPEPSAYALGFGLVVLALGACRRRLKRNKA